MKKKETDDAQVHGLNRPGRIENRDIEPIEYPEEEKITPICDDSHAENSECPRCPDIVEEGNDQEKGHAHECLHPHEKYWALVEPGHKCRATYVAHCISKRRQDSQRKPHTGERLPSRLQEI